MIRVLLVDDHGVVRAGLRQLLDGFEGIECVGAASDGAEAVELTLEHRPDVVLMDISMPVMDGIDATRAIAATCPGTKVVVLTSFSDRERILRALDVGAVGYLLKDAEPDELLRGIRAAARGDSPLAPKAARTILAARQMSRQPLRAGDDELSEREREVLVLLASGLANKQIARRLGISEKTVKAHLTHVFRRIGVSDRTQAALWAERNGFLGSESAAAAGY
jgi:DNA-binding NarL/FixJ family response regulator